MSKILRTHIRQLIQELWSKNKVTLGSPTSKEFFRYQSAGLYGYRNKYGKKDYRLMDLINIINKKDKSVANELKLYREKISNTPIFESSIIKELQKDLPSIYKLVIFLKYFFTKNLPLSKENTFSEKEIDKIFKDDENNPKITNYIAKNKFANFTDLIKFVDYIEEKKDVLNYTDDDSLSKVLKIIYKFSKKSGVTINAPSPSPTTTPQTTPSSASTQSTSSSTTTSIGQQGVNYTYTSSK